MRESDAELLKEKYFEKLITKMKKDIMYAVEKRFNENLDSLLLSHIEHDIKQIIRNTMLIKESWGVKGDYSFISLLPYIGDNTFIHITGKNLKSCLLFEDGFKASAICELADNLNVWAPTEEVTFTFIPNIEPPANFVVKTIRRSNVVKNILKKFCS